MRFLFAIIGRLLITMISWVSSREQFTLTGERRSVCPRGVTPPRRLRLLIKSPLIVLFVTLPVTPEKWDRLWPAVKEIFTSFS